MAELKLKLGVEDKDIAPNSNLREKSTPETSDKQPLEKSMIDINNVSFYYGKAEALNSINMALPEKKITSFIGPSGCGKSTLLRCLNRMNDMVEESRMEGEIHIGGLNINDPALEVSELRKRVGMVFQKFNPFPKTIFENVAYGPRVHGMKDKSQLEGVVEKSLKAVALWDEVKDRLDSSALALSGGQQQRLCIARAVAVEPEVLLMDEPCSALDPIATARIEELMVGLKEQYTIVIVTHNMQQAARVADFTGFLLLGELIEFDHTEKLFTNPSEKKTEDYITGRFG